ncbi:hypothetical protein BC941DRAFT_257693 [Chlamydoabsidia padenii]|nr:hypothetical protein BC941DRAFT_257693 [Chlamydoabsidia padenii]
MTLDHLHHIVVAAIAVILDLLLLTTLKEEEEEEEATLCPEVLLHAAVDTMMNDRILDHHHILGHDLEHLIVSDHCHILDLLLLMINAVTQDLAHALQPLTWMLLKDLLIMVMIMMMMLVDLTLEHLMLMMSLPPPPQVPKIKGVTALLSPLSYYLV